MGNCKFSNKVINKVKVLKIILNFSPTTTKGFFDFANLKEVKLSFIIKNNNRMEYIPAAIEIDSKGFTFEWNDYELTREVKSRVKESFQEYQKGDYINFN